MRVVVCTIVHHPADARLSWRRRSTVRCPAMPMELLKDIADQRETLATVVVRKLCRTLSLPGIWSPGRWMSGWWARD